MKTIPILYSVLLSISLFFGHTSHAQTEAQRLQVVTSVQQIQDLFEISLDGDRKSGVNISRQGHVVEWDSVSGFRLQYQLTEMDLDKAEIIDVESNAAAIQVGCLYEENCISLTGRAKKTSYYNNASIFSVPIEKKQNLYLILRKLKQLKKALITTVP